jgi:beta-glucosidase
MVKILLLILMLTAAVFAGNGSAIDAEIENLLVKMTLEEKIGQMTQYNGFWSVTGPVPNDGSANLKYDDLKNGLVGSMLNINYKKNAVENIRKVQEIAVNNSRLGIPLIFGLDVIHGYKTIMPVPLAEAASWDLDAIKKSARVAAAEASAGGINWTFAPMVDISRDPRWGRVMEGAGEDPYLGAKIAAARVNGFQGDDLAAVNTIAATAKHFAAYGFSEAGRDYNTVDVGSVTLYNTILPPFKSAVDNHVKTIMNSFNVLNGIPATANKFLLRDILNGDWAFKGFVVSDWSSIREMINHGYAADLEQAAELAVKAGCDMDMESYAYKNYLKKLVEEKKIDVSLIDDAVRRILRVKYELGLFDDPYRYCSPSRYKEVVGNSAHTAAALEIAKKSIVLLKNEKNIVPLHKTQKRIAVIGALAADKDTPLGNWRAAAEANSAVSVLEGIKKYTGNFAYARGIDSDSSMDKSGFSEAVSLAKNSDLVIMVLGENGNQSGEARSRAHIGLPGLQENLLKAVYNVNKKIILVLMNGRPLVITWADEHLPAILETWHLGSQSGNAIAAVLFGDYNPGGKLPMTFPRSIGQIPIYYNHYNTGRPYDKSNSYSSRYIDESNEPLYPFGYGLSYTQFKYDDLRIDDSNRESIKVSVEVKNTGRVKGEEVVQLYIRDTAAQVVRPVKELKGFKKIALNSGQSRRVEFVLTDKELGYYLSNGEYIVEPGEFELMVGTNSRDVLHRKFILK